MAATARTYVAPSRGDRAFAAVLAWLARRGIGVAGCRILAVRGRTTGEWRTTVVNLLDAGGARHLVAPRGETQWVRNLRAAGSGELRLGRRATAFAAVELPDDEKVPVLRAYLARWGWEVGRFFEGVDAKASDDALAAIAPDFPVFRVDCSHPQRDSNPCCHLERVES